MKTSVLISVMLFLLCGMAFIPTEASAGPGDTTVVQTFTFNWPGSPKEGTFLFPPADKRFEKILMYYTLKCDPKQNPACGEWDYLTYTRLFHHTGRFDSTGKEIVERYELGRFITPYGIGLDLGEGWTWVYDVTDFRQLLADSVHLKAGNWQELLDLKFIMIEGTPPRDVIKIENLWRGSIKLKEFAAKVPPRKIDLDPRAKMFKLRVTTTGHKFSNPTNCAEFCPKIHSINVDGVRRYQWQIRQECATNPLYPQGGTWIYDRAGWCPGMPATTQEIELTPYISGSSVFLDYNCEYDEYGNYIVETQFVSYGPPNHNRDAAVVEIKAPNRGEMYNRINPICARPLVVIQNTGAEILNSLDISYGPVGGNTNTYRWTGSLKFLEKKEVWLPAFNWGTWSGGNVFRVTVSNPNGGSDEYAYNNTMESHFETAPVYNSYLVISMRTNKAAYETYYEILNAAGKPVFTKKNLLNNAIYRDTIRLMPGCYEFVIHDYGDDGISFWANNDGSGSVIFRLTGGGLWKTMNPDFGKEWRMQFTYSSLVNVEEIAARPVDFSVFPNPANGALEVTYSVDVPSQLRLRLLDVLGRVVKEIDPGTVAPGKHRARFDISDLAPGNYFVALVGNGAVIRKVNIIIVR
ncbi:MAG: T9SS type A sorting domain-containing protein [Chlorobi bacterium]|nr:T9SS type A sorting domain-containing protein [Chlorobiota bacterium]